MKMSIDDGWKLVSVLKSTHSQFWLEIAAEYHPQFDELPTWVLVDDIKNILPALEVARKILEPYFTKYNATKFPIYFSLLSPEGVQTIAGLEGYEMLLTPTPSPIYDLESDIEKLDQHSVFKTVRDAVLRRQSERP